MERYKAKVECKNCGSTKFILEQEVEGETRESIVMQKTLCHDGWGWELESFDMICCNCGGIDTAIVKLYEPDH